MANNKLNHNKTLSNLNTEVKYANDERRWSRYGRNGENAGAKGFKAIRRAYNKAHRKASKLQLSRYQEYEELQHELNAEYYQWEDEMYQQDMDWTIGRDERQFNAEVRATEVHLFREEVRVMQRVV